MSDVAATPDLKNVLRGQSKPFPYSTPWVVFGTVALVLWSAFPEDLEQLRVLRFWGIQMYVADLIYLMLLVSSFGAVMGKRLLPLGKSEIIFLAFLGWLVLCVLRGSLTFGFRALGEARYVIPFFSYFLPFALLSRVDNRFKKEAAGRLISRVIMIAGLTSFIMLWVEIAHGGRFFISEMNKVEIGTFEDFRGKRYLGSTQTLNIMALALLLAVRVHSNYGSRLKDMTLMLVALLAALLTRNRAALFSVVFSYFIMLLLLRRFRTFLLITSVVVVGLFVVNIVSPADPLNIGTSLSSGLSPEEDETGMWRMVVNIAAIEQGMSTPIIGAGFGGYYYFEVPGMSPIEYPVHNQFILLFLKGGLVAVALSLAWLLSYLIKYMSFFNHEKAGSISRIYALWLSIIVVSQFAYGMAYAFTPLFGFYLGCGVAMCQHCLRPATLNSSNDEPAVVGT